MSIQTKTSKIAVIDVGSNSVRILYDDNTLYKETITTRLGQLKDGLLSEEGIKRTVDAVLILYARALQKGIEKVYIFATAAVRNAKNGQVFTQRVKELISIDVDVVSGEEECMLGLVGAYGKIASGGVIDVGGASSEVIFSKNGKIEYKYSLNIGAVRLYDMFNRDKIATDKYLTNLMNEYGKIPSGDYKIIGGTATSLASIILKLKEYDANITDGTLITREQLKNCVEMLYSMSVEEIEKSFCIQKKRCDIIAGGANIILKIMEYANIDRVVVSEKDNLEGYLIKVKQNYEK